MPANCPKWALAHRQRSGLRCPTDATLGSTTERIELASTRAVQHERQKSVWRSFGPSRRSLTIYLCLPCILKTITDMYGRHRKIVSDLREGPKERQTLS